MSKYDWTSLKIEYLSGSYKNLREFSDIKGINYQVVKNNSKGWNEEKLHYNNEKVTKTVTKTVDMLAKRDANRNLKHLEVWDKLLDRVATLAGKDKIIIGVDDTGNIVYEDLDPKMLLTLANSIDKIQKGQRLAEGISTAIEISRLELEKQRLDLYKKKSGTDEDLLELSNKNIVLLSDLVNNPLPDRTIDDIEGDNKDEE